MITLKSLEKNARRFGQIIEWASEDMQERWGADWLVVIRYDYRKGQYYKNKGGWDAFVALHLENYEYKPVRERCRCEG